MDKKIYIVVTIDTECDKDLNWKVKQPLVFRNIQLQEKVLMPVFRECKIKPTYLLSPEVLADNQSVAYFKGIAGEIELGTHLHAEFINPNADFKSKTTSTIQKQLSFDEELLKIKNLTNLFKEKFGYLPLSFRSGRFGSSKNTSKILASLNYKVDSSVCPFKTHYFENGLKINHWGKTIKPSFEYFKNSKILQVPLTLVNKDFRRLPNFILKKIETKSSFLKKVLFKFGFKSKTRWLRPYRENDLGLISIADDVIHNSFRNDNRVVLNIMFHSNEILPGGSPYCKNEEEVFEFQNSLRELFLYLSKHYNLCSIGLGELYGIYCQK